MRTLCCAVGETAASESSLAVEIDGNEVHLDAHAATTRVLGNLGVTCVQCGGVA